MEKLKFMRRGAVESVRCRVYGGEVDRSRQRAFVNELARDGVLDCPAYDKWVSALQERGWLPPEPELEPNPAGPGMVGRWRLTSEGRAEAVELGVLDA